MKLIAERKPLKVRAFQWTGDCDALIRAMTEWSVPFVFEDGGRVSLQAPQGRMYASIGDYIAEGIKGGGWYTASKEGFENAHDLTVVNDDTTE